MQGASILRVHDVIETCDLCRVMDTLKKVSIMRWIQNIDQPHLSGWIEISILAFLIYSLFRFFHGTRGSSIFSGLIVLFGMLYALTTIIKLDVLNWLLSNLTSIFL